MNRRSFVRAGAITTAFIWTGLAAKQTTVFESVFTGAEIDLADSGFTLKEQAISSDGKTERILFNRNGSILSIDFAQVNSQDFAGTFESMAQTSSDAFDGFENHALEHMTDGGVLAMSWGDEASYYEYQLGAFPDFDILAAFFAPKETFHEDFEAIQSIVLGGAPPFLFTNESAVADITFGAGATSEEPTGGVTRSTRGSDNASTTDDSTEPAVSDSNGEADFIAHISEHRATFTTSLQNFHSDLDAAAELVGTGAGNGVYETAMVTTATRWLTYPADIANVAVPAGSEAIGDLYTEWGEAIFDLGSSVISVLVEGGPAEPFGTAMDALLIVDSELATAIGEPLNQGYRGTALWIPEKSMFEMSLKLEMARL